MFRETFGQYPFFVELVGFSVLARKVALLAVDLLPEVDDYRDPVLNLLKNWVRRATVRDLWRSSTTRCQSLMQTYFLVVVLVFGGIALLLTPIGIYLGATGSFGTIVDTVIERNAGRNIESSANGTNARAVEGKDLSANQSEKEVISAVNSPWVQGFGLMAFAVVFVVVYGIFRVFVALNQVYREKGQFEHNSMRLLGSGPLGFAPVRVGLIALVRISLWTMMLITVFYLILMGIGLISGVSVLVTRFGGP